MSVHFKALFWVDSTIDLCWIKVGLDSLMFVDEVHIFIHLKLIICEWEFDS